MNTPDTEWEKEKFDELLTLVRRGHEATINEEEVEEYYGELRTFITNLRTSRDTYWKERVRKEVEGMKERAQFGRETSWEIEHANGYNKALKDVDTLLDNLK